MPDSFHRRMIASYARYIVRHRLFIRWEIAHQTMTLKLHKVAQLRCVELTSSVFVGLHEGGTTVIRRFKAKLLFSMVSRPLGRHHDL